MSLVRLACSHCGGDLPAPPDAVLFACPACGRASALAGGRLAAAATAAVPPRLTTAAGVAGCYPAWVFAVTWTALPAAPPAPGVAPAWRAPDRIVVPSLAAETGGAYLRLARALSLAAADWSPVAQTLRAVAGGQIGAVEAAHLLCTVALACLPAAPRQKLLETDAPPLAAGPPTLVWLPFARAGGRLRDLVAGCEVSDRVLGAAPPPAARAAAPATDATAPVPRPGTGAVAPSREPEPVGSVDAT